MEGEKHWKDWQEMTDSEKWAAARAVVVGRRGRHEMVEWLMGLVVAATRSLEDPDEKQDSPRGEVPDGEVVERMAGVKP